MASSTVHGEVAMIAKVSVCVQDGLSRRSATDGPLLDLVHSSPSVSGEDSRTQTFLSPIPSLN